MNATLARAIVYFGSSAIGLLVAALSLRGFRMGFWGFVIAVVVFSVAQSILSPLVSNLVDKYATSLSSLVGLISAYLSLLIASLFTDGIHIRGLGTWILATLLVWIIPSIATILLRNVLPSSE